MNTRKDVKGEKEAKLEYMLIKRAPNPFTFDYEYIVVLNRLNGALLELKGDLAALYQMLNDEWISGNELSRLYLEKYGRPLDPAHLKFLEAVEGLIYVKSKQ